MKSIHIKRIFTLLAAALAYFYFAIAIASQETLPFDDMVADKVKNVLGGPILDVFTILGSTKGFAIIAVIVLLWLGFKRKDYRAVGVFVLALLSGYLVNSFLKEWHNRPRPASEQLVEVDTLSFPSGNAMIGLLLYSLTAYFLMRNLHSAKRKFAIGLGAFVIILLYGASRIALNVHYLSDIVAGFAMGVIWMVCWIYVYEAFLSKGLNKTNKSSLPL